MTYEEARDIREALDRSKLSNKLFKLARKAINRRVPKVPYIMLGTWKCPNCEASYEIANNKYNFCPYCGQAIDWLAYEEDE